MWKKFLAVACIPFVALFAISFAQVLFKTYSKAPEGQASYRVAFHVGWGLGALLTLLLLFFSSRWIWRTLVGHPVEGRVRQSDRSGRANG